MSESSLTPHVFATVGTDHHPFDRLVAWVDRWASLDKGRGAFVQHGTSRRPAVADSADYLTYQDMTQALVSASAVVCHGGPATIMEARRSGKVPIVIARRPTLGEHVDDHQMLFTARLAEREQIHLVEDEESLHDQIDRAVVDPLAFQLERDDPTLALAVHRFEVLVDELLMGRNG